MIIIYWLLFSGRDSPQIIELNFRDGVAQCLSKLLHLVGETFPLGKVKDLYPFPKRSIVFRRIVKVLIADVESSSPSPRTPIVRSNSAMVDSLSSSLLFGQTHHFITNQYDQKQLEVRPLFTY